MVKGLVGAGLKGGRGTKKENQRKGKESLLARERRESRKSLVLLRLKESAKHTVSVFFVREGKEEWEFFLGIQRPRVSRRSFFWVSLFFSCSHSWYSKVFCLP